jgi:hypothetical protein
VHSRCGARHGEGNQFLRTQAEKAERRARATAEISENLLNLAKAYRTQADVLKGKRKQKKKRLPLNASPQYQ